MIRANHPLILLLSVLGLVPFLGCAYLASAWQSSSEARGMISLLAYGAVILSFLGGIHWGWVLAEGEVDDLGLPPASLPSAIPSRVQKGRIALGVLPALVGWVALLIGILAPAPAIGLSVLIAGFIATMVVEQGGHRYGFLSKRYLWLRWALTIVVVAILTTVVVLRLTGARVIL
jgi:Protein of unknown function (DUF3429)